MIDNFELLKSLLNYNEKDKMFYHCQIVQRSKDYPKKKVKGKAVQSYLIKSKEHLEELKDEIILLCEHYGARAYINVAPKEFKSLQRLVLCKFANYNFYGVVVNPRRAVNSATGELKPKEARWVVDLDADSDNVLKYIKATLLNIWYKAWNDLGIPNTMEQIEKECIIAEVPTKQGLHLITKPFNLKEFKDIYPNIDVHKNSMGTLLYYPKCLDNGNKC